MLLDMQIKSQNNSRKKSKHNRQELEFGPGVWALAIAVLTLKISMNF